MLRLLLFLLGVVKDFKEDVLDVGLGWDGVDGRGEGVLFFYHLVEVKEVIHSRLNSLLPFDFNFFDVFVVFAEVFEFGCFNEFQNIILVDIVLALHDLLSILG